MSCQWRGYRVGESSLSPPLAWSLTDSFRRVQRFPGSFGGPGLGGESLSAALCSRGAHVPAGLPPPPGPGLEGDFSGHLLAYLSLSPIFVIVGFVTLIIFKRELHTISFLGGLALNEGVNWLIKHVIQEPRPCGGPHMAVGTKYGMPSSHSQFMWFFSVYSFLFLYLRMHQTNNARFLDLLWRHVLSLGLLAAAFLVSYSRVYLLYHTWSQVLYGGIAGSLMAVAWFAFTQEVLTPLFPRIAAWPISEFFLIRDTSLIPNVLWFEYTVTRAEARNRQRKLGTKLQ
ncbi:dolichyldiphosphatase 1 isoform X1 [Meles meles]|uniref:dolichyldiphosphatase 1 isoform X1 n=1 Tax=Meles meles TaxID=9662 RepID=UPI001E69D30F|nr:dolichyldiphosphatase 1 isoform X1 [Meles meles]